jgi:protoheme ferro-lyase
MNISRIILVINYGTPSDLDDLRRFIAVLTSVAETGAIGKNLS